MSIATRRSSHRVYQSARFAVETLERRTLLSAGQLDPNFGTGGKVLLPDQSGLTFYRVNTMAIQGDGKILLAGEAGSGPDRPGSFFLGRVNADGTVDTSFGTNGVVTTSFGNLANAVSIAIQPDGKILLGGTQETDDVGTNGQFALARYNTNGSLDTTFGTGGTVLTRIPGQESLESIALAPNGDIVAGGTGTYQDPAHPNDSSYSTHAFEVARYKPNGALDVTFDGDGYVVMPSSTKDTYSEALAVTLEGDGQVLVGYHLGIDFALWQFNVDGSLDTHFGLDGRAVTPFAFFDYTQDGFASGSISQILVQPNGRILVAGAYEVGDDRQYLALSRYNSDGSLDTGFGTQGLVLTTNAASGPVGPNTIDQPGGLALQPDGKIIIGGIDRPAPSQPGPFFVARLLPNGSTDPTFQSGDVSFFPNTQTNHAYAGATALAPDGTIVVAGNIYNNSYIDNSNGQGGIGIVRLQGDSTPTVTPLDTQPANPSGTLPGDLDGTFGFQGRTLLNDPSPIDFPDAITPRVKATAVLPNGQILLAGSIGTVADNGQGDFWLERLNADDTVDTSFGTNGSVETSIGINAFATSMLVLPSAQILLGGGTDNSATAPTAGSFALARYNANGSLDTSFGTGGIVITDFAGNEEVDALALTPDGKIVAAGEYFLYPNVGFDLARYNANGALDTSFNGTGMLSYSLGQTGSDSLLPGLAVQSDDKIVVGAHQNSEFALYRFNANGSADSMFGVNGVALTTGATSTGAVTGAVTKLAIERNGEILAAGQTLSGLGLQPYALARFNTNGSLDSTFGTNGIVKVDATTEDFFPLVFPLAGLLLQTDGGIILVGQQQTTMEQGIPNALPQPLIRKFLPDGTTDPSFQTDQDSAYLPPPPDFGAVAEAAAFTPSGNFIVVSDVYGASHYLGVARYLNNAPPVSTTPVQLTGTVIGTTGSWDNLGNTVANAFDGNLSTYFDASQSNGAWAGLDLGSAEVITQIRYAPRPNYAGRMIGGVFQGSNTPDFSSGVVTLYTITTIPVTGVLNTVNISNSSAFRYVRYLGPNYGHCNVAEIQFWGTRAAGLSTLGGTIIGTPGSYNNLGNTISNVFDGNLSTFFDAPFSTGAWVGLDLGSPEVIKQVRYAPRALYAGRMLGGMIQASNTADFSSGVVTLYTITTMPVTGALNTVTLSNTSTFRYVRYIGPAYGSCNIAELQFNG